jgi:hypothetical protein
MKGSSSSDWLKAVPFIYPGEGAEVTWENLEELLVLGDKYHMPDLASRASKFLKAHQAELNSDDKDYKYIWKWILLLDHAAGKKSLCEACIQRVATQFSHTCTREEHEGFIQRGSGNAGDCLGWNTVMVSGQMPIVRGVHSRKNGTGLSPHTPLREVWVWWV